MSEQPATIWKTGPTSAPLPPMVPGLPLLGNALDLSNDILGYLVAMHQKYGNIFRVRLLRDVYTVIAGREANMFLAREGSRHFRSKEFWEGLDEEFGTPYSLISSDGEIHKQLRQLQKRGYARSMIDTNYQAVVDITRRRLDAWPIGERRPALRFIQEVITEQLGLILIGRAPGDYIDDIGTFTRTGLLVHVTRQRPGLLLKLPAYRNAKARSFAFARELIAYHRANPPVDRAPNLIDDALAAVGNSVVREDLLMNIALGPYIAGLDTSAGTLAFMMYAIHKNADVIRQVQPEADALFADGVPTPEQLGKADALHRTALETFRRYPIAPMLQRTATAPFEFGGYRIDEGQRVMIGITVPHYQPEYHPEPFAFDIDRYLPPRNEHRIPGAFAPFSLGSHTCLGAGIAETQVMLTAAVLLNAGRFVLEPADYELKVRSSPTPAPGKDFVLRRVG